ncbi:MAG TPA: MlaE family lipid ABC transporter permease subunit, partial [Geminicoccaceae bacterium]|nr:MlaE family lipid ABC transporter permease subunit [Geminicoccaceae bacterium]
MDAWLSSTRQGDRLLVEAGGGWTLSAITDLYERRERLLAESPGPGGAAAIDLAALHRLDTAGAWLLQSTRRELAERGWQVEWSGASAAHASLLAEVERATSEPLPPAPVINPILRLIANLGQSTLSALREGGRLLSFYGQTVVALARTSLQPRRIRLTALTHHLEQTCVDALPIVGLIAFLIGIVLAYQGADQLRQFGAEIFTVDLLAISALREVGVLLTAVVVAGRSGSAFTAEIGIMKVNEEIDALRTLGLDPLEVLVLPRLVALMIALPLLAFFADIMALLGGGLMCAFALDISPEQYIARLREAIWPRTFWVGIVKAPVFAFSIAMVACYEGLTVDGSAESVGRNTTLAVVVGIFLVIV